MKPIVFLDLDRTLFDSDAFFSYVNQELIASFNVTPQILNEHQYLLAVGTINHLRYTDFDALLDALHVNKQAFITHITTSCASDAFILKDAVPFISWVKQQNTFEPRILSYGQYDFQYSKITVSPILHSFPVDIIMTKKNVFIENNYQNRTGILVDDKPDQHLPTNWFELYIDRKAVAYEKPSKIEDSVTRITTLDDAPSNISSALQ